MFISGMSKFGQEFAKAICENPDEITSITLNCAVDSVVFVTIEKMITDETADKIIQIIQKAAWIETQSIDEKESEKKDVT